MKIYFDVRCLQDQNYKDRGVGVHTLGIVKHARQFIDSTDKLIAVVDNFTYPLLEQRFRKYFDETINSFSYVNNHADIYINAFPFGPNQNNNTKIINNKRIYSSCLFYDLIPALYPDRYLISPSQRLEFYNNLMICSKYDSILSISKSSINHLKIYLDLEESRFLVTGASVSDDYLNKSQDRKEFKIPFLKNSYFIMVGGGDDRKNMDFALKAFGIYKKNNRNNHGFVLVGKYSNEQKERFNNISVEFGFEKDFIIVSGISNLELKNLYSNAIANICPSISEGFFIPLVEGLACNCLPLSSTCEAQCELLNNDQELIFSLKDEFGLVQLMEKVITDKTFVENKLLQHKNLVYEYSDYMVSKKVWTKILSDYKLRTNIPKIKDLNQINHTKPLIAFVTPYPSDKSGCADYSYSTIKALSKRADVDLYTNADNISDKRFVSNIRRISLTPYILKKYDAVISVIGNSHFHSMIYDYVLNQGGYVIEHDNRLLDFVNWKFGTERAAGIASEELGRVVLTSEINEWLQGKKHFETLFLNDLFDSSTKMFLHSKSLIDNYYRINNRKANYLPFCKYNEYPVNNLDEKLKRISRSKLKIQDNEIAIVTFGAVVSSKLYEECIRSISYLPKSKDRYFKLYFIGECGKAEYEYSKNIIDSLGINVMILPYKYYSKEEYSMYLQASDVSIQLRKHRLGGLSGGLMDSICAGLPNVANEDLANAMESPNYTIRIINDPTPRDIAKGIIDALSYKEFNKDTIKVEMNQYIDTHNFENYSSLLLKEIGIYEN